MEQPAARRRTNHAENQLDLEEGLVETANSVQFVFRLQGMPFSVLAQESRFEQPQVRNYRYYPAFPAPGTYELKVCTQCGVCEDVCPTGAIKKRSDGILFIDEAECIGCGVCIDACPEQVIRFVKEKNAAFKCISLRRMREVLPKGSPDR